MVNNNGVLESLPLPPNQGGTWRLVYLADAVPPRYDWENAAGGFASELYPPAMRKKGGGE